MCIVRSPHVFTKLALQLQDQCHCIRADRALYYGFTFLQPLTKSMSKASVADSAGPMLEQDGQTFNKYWGYLSRAGLNDKSQFTRQIEKYADIYTSRVANFLRYTPYMYFRSPSQSLAHDRHFYGLEEDRNGSTDADGVD